MRIAVIGAGFTGLTIGYLLTKTNHQVTIFEKNNFAGGLASGVKLGNWYLERFYHHIFQDDKDVQELCLDLGLKNIWIWKKCGAPIYFQGKIYPFSTAVDLLNFKPLPVIDRLRTGIASLYLQLNGNYHQFENIKAKYWLRKWMGDKSFEVIWQPLLTKKFGKMSNFVPMTWMWARIHKRSRILGYPKEGFQAIINKLIDEISVYKGKIYLKKEITKLSQLNKFDKIIFTGQTPQFLKLLPSGLLDYKKRLKHINYLGVVCVLLLLKKPLTSWGYWLNINDNKIPFLICAQQSNFINNSAYQGYHPVYLAAYISRYAPFYMIKPGEIVSLWSKHLAKINKNFSKSWIIKQWVFKESFAQPVFKLGDHNFVPKFTTPLKNVYLVNMSQTYPWDRGINYAVALAKNFVSNIN